MKDIAIYGAGGFGREVACLIKAINQVEPTWNLIGFFDDGEEVGQMCKYGTVLGNMDTLNSWPTDLSIVFAIGSAKTIKFLSERVTNPKIQFPNLIAPNVQFFDKEELNLGKGNIITFGCRLSTNITIGDFNILNGCVSLGHDVSIGNYNVLFPETRISGMVTVGDGNFFGARSFVSQMINIPGNVRIGAGAVLLKKPKPEGLYMGNPAKLIKI